MGGTLTAEEREKDIRKLAAHMGMDNPHVICDMLLWKGLGIPSIDPFLLEKWLVKHGKYHPENEDESIEDCMGRVYGAEWAALAKSLI